MSETDSSAASIASAVEQVMLPLVLKCDKGVNDVLMGQDVLNKQIDDLAQGFCQNHLIQRTSSFFDS